MSTLIVWFRRDLRLADHPALTAAVANGARIVPVFVWNPAEDAPWSPGAATRWYLQASLRSLAASLEALGSRLVLARGDPFEVLPRLAAACDATAVTWSRRYEPSALKADAAVEAALRAASLAPLPCAGSLLCEPWTLLGRSGTSYKVFTPYWREFLARTRVNVPLTTPESLPPPQRWPASESFETLGIAPTERWQMKLAAHWKPGEDAASEALKTFAARSPERYASDRDRTDLGAGSRLSPHLHHGELSPRQVWVEVGRQARRSGQSDEDWRSGKFLSELIWREFAAQALYHFPELPDRSFLPQFESLEWREAPADFAAWSRGRTGIAMVDAGMRELWETGWMHNRSRMIVASFLVKNLLIHWREGARWFWDTLVDADLANNSLNWQWVAGTGPDAAPWFRIFNPDTQAEKFDPEGAYRQRWLGTRDADVAKPIADLKSTRERALAAQKQLRGSR
ncbi:MAG: deoxyribodipyrimidine photo-lyase [Steroidobacteraceae bacterium]